MDADQRRLAARSLLDFWADMGVIEPGDSPELPRGSAAPRTPARPSAAAETAAREPAAPRPLSTNPIEEASRRAASALGLKELESAVNAFELCPLRRTAKRTVFGDGAQDAAIMLIGEAPGAEEDAAGRPFVGPSGQLLDRMLLSIGLERGTNVYIANLVYWRPPGNREPTAEEVAICRPFLRRQIDLINPALILTAGKPAAQEMLGVDEGIMRLRGREHAWRPGSGADAKPLIPLLHPSYLLRRPQEKAKAWADLRRVAAVCDRLVVARRPRA